MHQLMARQCIDHGTKLEHLW